MSDRFRVLARCNAIRRNLNVVPKSEARPLVALETVERWVRGESSIEEVRAAAAGAYDAAASYSYAYAHAYENATKDACARAADVAGKAAQLAETVAKNFTDSARRSS